MTQSLSQQPPSKARGDKAPDPRQAATLPEPGNDDSLYADSMVIAGNGARTDEGATQSPVRLLWTGGWDSTYRLLELLLVLRRPVQPIYIIHPRRSSTEYELRTMDVIREKVKAMDPRAAELCLPTIFENFGDYRIDPLINQRYRQLRRRFRVGRQYRWLAGYVELSDSPGFELAIEHIEYSPWLRALSQHMERVQQDGDYWYVLREDAPDHFQIFRGFRFPVFDLTKTDMRAIAAKEGFLPILNRSWFCFTPVRGRFPCGICRACQTTIKAGMHDRIHLPFRVLLRFYERYLMNIKNRRLHDTLRRVYRVVRG